MSYTVNYSCVEKDPVKRQNLINQVAIIMRKADERNFLEEMERQCKEREKKEQEKKELEEQEKSTEDDK